MKFLTPHNHGAPDTYTISRVVLDDHDGVRRLAPRRVDQRQENYDSLFDDRTLVCDAFWSGGEVVLVSPPPLNLKEDARLTLDVGGVVVDVLEAGSDLDRTFYASVPGIESTVKEATLALEPAGTSTRIPIQPDEGARFAGKDVVVTQQKDNDLEWVATWVEFHHTIHGFDSFLIYDNSSSRYDVSELRGAISKVAPEANVAIVDWNVPFGVTGGPDQKWDSDYGQHAAWEHARRRFLNQAHSATFVDVDELIVSESGRRLTSRLRHQKGGGFRLNRFDMATNILVPTETVRRRRHIDYVLRPRNVTLVNTKPGVIMAGLAPDSQIKIHYVTNCDDDVIDDFVVRHFIGLRLDWRNDSSEHTTQDVYAILKPDGDLVFDYPLYRDFLKLRWSREPLA